MTLNLIICQTEESQACVFLHIFESSVQLCGFHGNPTFLSCILPEIFVLNSKV